MEIGCPAWSELSSLLIRYRKVKNSKHPPWLIVKITNKNHNIVKFEFILTVSKSYLSMQWNGPLIYKGMQLMKSWVLKLFSFVCEKAKDFVMYLHSWIIKGIILVYYLSYIVLILRNTNVRSDFNCCVFIAVIELFGFYLCSFIILI